MDGFGFVLGDALTDVVHGPEIVLRRGVALLGGEAVPANRFGFVLGDALPMS